jgi:hypothetical protein
LRDATYNYYLRGEFGLDGIEGWLEIPLDEEVAKRLAAEPLGRALPKWPGLSRLARSTSQEYQNVANLVASERGIARVHLDLEYWPAFSRAAL